MDHRNAPLWVRYGDWGFGVGIFGCVGGLWGAGVISQQIFPWQECLANRFWGWAPLHIPSCMEVGAPTYPKLYGGGRRDFGGREFTGFSRPRFLRPDFQGFLGERSEPPLRALLR